MIAEKYLNMNKEDAFRELIVDYMARPSEGKQISEELLASEKYKNDFEFRVIVDATRGTLLSIFGEYQEVLSLCKDVLERADAFKMWDVVSLVWNILGTTYFMFGIYERAIECFYNTISNEETNGLSWFSSSAYSNIGQIYMKLGENYKAQEYFKQAFDYLEYGGEDQPRYLMKKISYLCDMALELTQTDGLDAAKLILDEIEEFDFTDLDPETIYDYYYARMFYYFYSGDTKEGKKAFLECRKSPNVENLSELNLLLRYYIELCERAGLSIEDYEDELMEIKETSQGDSASIGVWVYKRIRQHYKGIGDEKANQEATLKYIEMLERESLENKLQKVNSVKLISSLLKDSGSLKNVSSKNEELKMIADEANKRKNELQEAYQRIETISKLGSKITSSINLNEVVNLISEIIKEHIKYDALYLVVTNKKEGVFKSLFSYFDGEEQDPIILKIDDPTSLIAYCYREKRVILSTEEVFKSKILAKLEEDGEIDENVDVGLFPSAVYVPLIADEEVIGICTIQDKMPGLYKEEELKFLEELTPYLSIALNNAMKSWELEKEIDSHLATRHKLEKANERLERISSLDGLTEINGRRVFDAKMIELMNSAKLLKSSISIFMLDIDSFKLYNDTYGHLEGDEILKKVAQIFRRNMDRKSGLSARFGGEEFIGACLGLDYNESKELAETIRKDIFEMNIPHKATALGRLTISVGVAFSDCVNRKEKSELMKIADESLYEAKNSGKNRVVIARG